MAASSLLPRLSAASSVAEGVVKAVAPTGVPVTAKIRIGWDAADDQRKAGGLDARRMRHRRRSRFTGGLDRRDIPARRTGRSSPSVPRRRGFR